MKNIRLTSDINQYKIPPNIILTGKLLRVISKNLNIRYLSKLFTTPIKFKAPQRELMFRQSAKSEKIVLPNAKKEIIIYQYGYSKKKILLVHGWSGRGSQFYNLADKLLEHKMMIISFDAPAHGLSNGTTCHYSDFIESISEIDKQYGPFYAAIGHSYGAMALSSALQKNLSVEKLVLLSTPNSFDEIITKFIKKMEQNTLVKHQLYSFFSKRHNLNLNDYTLSQILLNQTIPTLIIHDTKDTYVDVSNAIVIRQSLHNGKLLLTNGLGHHKIFKNSTIVHKIVKFIQ